MLRRTKDVERKASEAANDLSPDSDVPLKNPSARLGEILLSEKIVTQEQLDEALEKQRAEGGFLGQALIELKYLDQSTLTLFLVKQCKIPHLNLLDYQIDQEVVDLIPEELCRKHRILPVDKMGKILTVAMVDPLNVEALTAIRDAYPDLRIKPILCDWPQYEIVSERCFNPAPEDKKEEELEDNDPLSKLVLPARKSAAKKKTAKPSKVTDEGAGDAAAVGQALPEMLREALSESTATIIEGIFKAQDQTASKLPSPEELAQAIAAALRDELAAQGSAAGAGDGGEAPARSGLSAMEKKLETLAASVAQIAQASEVFQAARRAEEQQVAEALRSDLEPGGSSVEQGIQGLSQGEESGKGGSLGAAGDAATKASLETGAPLGGYSFDTFLVGEGNAPALELGKAVAESPGAVYNPFFICGDVGLGKTHLINAIGNSIVEHDSSLRVGYASAGRFASHVTMSIEQGMQHAFRDAYSQWDVLILDDIQFLGGHVEAQEEFFHVFNGLHQAGRQIIIAGDKPPQRLGLLEERLVSRFESGMVTHLQPPEWETRMDILRHHAKVAKAKAPEEVLAMVSMKYPSDVRRLIGSFQKILAYARLEGGGVTCALADKVLLEAGAVEAA